MKYSVDDFLKQASHYADELDLHSLIDSIDFSKVDTKKLKKIDFSKGAGKARKQLSQLPRVRVTTAPEPKRSGFLPGMILGVVLGIIVAVLIAPKEGKNSFITVVKDEPTAPSGGSDANEIAENTLPDEPAIERNFG